MAIGPASAATLTPAKLRSPTGLAADGSNTSSIARIALILPGVVAAMACLDLLGWILHLPLLTSVFPHYATMKPNTAVCLGVLALACWLRSGQRPAGPRLSLADGIAGFPLAIGAGSLAEYIFRVSLGLDNLFLRVPGDRMGDPAGRMSVGTAFCVVLLGAALLLIDRLPRLSVAMMMTAGGLALSALIGFVFNAGPLFGVPWLTSLAVHTATGLLLLALAALSVRPEREPLQSLLGEAHRERRSRWLLLGVTVLPLVLAAPLVLLLRFRLADAGFTLALLVVLLTGIQTLILWRDSVMLRRVEERKVKAEQALLQSEKLAVVGRLAASIAHEINNPLESVGTLVYLIQDTDSLEEAARYARMAQEELLRVTQITSQTLNFYRESRNKANCEPLGILESALGLLKAKITASGVTLIRQFEEGLGVVNCLDGELRQVFINLVSNALEATPRGGRLIVRAKASRSWKTNAAGVRIVFADTGTGMPPEVRKRIFEPFYTTKAETGNGLGLWVAQELIEKHGGRLRVWSSTRPGASGTVFSVFLPLVEA